MPNFRIIAPLDQPEDRFRGLQFLRLNLSALDLDRLYIITAFAKESPLLKIKTEIDSWRVRGGLIEAMFGIDERGTSIEALQFALNNFNMAYVSKVVGGARSTFHPKIYLFQGPARAVAYIGSNNLTPGGLETNAEGGVLINLDLPADASLFADIMNCWTDTLRICLPLTAPLIASLSAEGKIISELQMRSLRASTYSPGGSATSIPFPRIRVVAPLAIPAGSGAPATGTPRTPSGARRPTAAVPSSAPATPHLSASNVNALVIQIVPHNNGEIFLSKLALNQNPAFFGYPFTGWTIPKITGNPAYPQRTPDPIVNLFIYDTTDTLVHQELNLNLNTVFYTTKSDIRITVNAQVARSIPESSVLVMEIGSAPGLDYELHVYPPGSPLYSNYLSVCNQQMPLRWRWNR